MSLTSRITTGIIESPYCVLLYGIEGIGKSSWAAKCPKPLYLDLEKGTKKKKNVGRITDIKTWDQAIETIDQIYEEDLDYKTLVIDTLDWLEGRALDKILKDTGKNLNTVLGGYGAGRAELTKMFRGLFDKLIAIKEDRGMHVVLLAHSQMKTKNDPELNESYDRYILKLDEKVAGVLKEFCDDVLFATYKTYVKKKDNEPAKTFGSGVRVVFSERRPAFDAKNRNGLPYEMPLEWADYEAAVQAGEPESAGAIRQRIDGLLSICKDAALKKTVIETIEKNPDDVSHLEAIANRLRVRLGDDA